MIFYTAFLLCIILLCGRYNIVGQGNVQVHNLKRKYGFFIAIVVIIVISSIRYGIGYDWYAYENIILRYENGINWGMYELFDNILFYIGASLNNVNVSFALFAILTYGLVGITIYNNSVDKFTSLIIYFTIFYLTSLSTIRQALAVAVSFWAIQFVKRKQPIRFVLSIIVAFCFHRYAFIALVIYPIWYLPTWIILLGIILMVGLYQSILPALITRFSIADLFYIDNFKNSSGNFIRIVYLLIFLYCVFLYVFALIKKRNIAEQVEVMSYLKISLIGVVIPFILGGHTGGRIAEYFLIYIVLLVPLINRHISLWERVISMLPFYAFYYIFLYTTTKVGTSYIPYMTFFQNK